MRANFTAHLSHIVKANTVAAAKLFLLMNKFMSTSVKESSRIIQDYIRRTSHATT